MRGRPGIPGSLNMSLIAGFNALVETVDQPMLLLDGKGGLLGANAHARRLLSIADDFSVGAPLSRWTVEHEHYALADQLMRWYRSRTPIVGTLKHCRDDGELISTQWRGCSIGDIDGEHGILLRMPNPRLLREGFLTLKQKADALSREIAERKRIEASLARREQELRLLLESSGQPFYGINREGKCTFANPACVDGLGYESEQALLGKNMHELVHHSYKDGRPMPVQECRIYNAFGTGTKVWVDAEEVFWRKDGTSFPVEYSAFPIRRGNDIVGTVVSFRDISRWRNAEAKIVKLNEELESRVNERTAALADAKQRLESTVDELKQTQSFLIHTEKMAALGQLVAGVAHEINTPIGIGVTAASYLKDQVQHYHARYQDGSITRGDFENLMSAILELTEMIMVNLDRASKLIKSFKRVAVDQSSEIRQVFSLRTYLEEIIASLAPQLRKYRHHIEIVCPDTLELDSYPGIYSQIITNLVLNSVLHAFDDEEAGTITLRVVPRDHDFVLLYQDDGLGMTAEVQQHIFDPFYTTRRGMGGSGLGMYLVFNLVTSSLCGKIDCVSKLGEGVTFTLTLPYCSPENAREKCQGGNEVAFGAA